MQARSVRIEICALVCLGCQGAVTGSDVGGAGGGRGGAANGGAAGLGSGGVDGGGGLGSGGAGLGSDAGPDAGIPPFCEGQCCPTDPTCSPTPAAYSGPECLAQLDNTGQTTWQLRQTWVGWTLPRAFAGGPVAAIMASESGLPWPICNMGSTPSGLIELLDLDLASGVARTGYAASIQPVGISTAINQGLCMVAGDYSDPAHVLPTNLAIGLAWPSGLAGPMLLPFAVAPVRATLLSQDFDLATDRVAILAKFAPGGAYSAGGFTGIFYLDPARGYLHAYSPLGYMVEYESSTQREALPLRERELSVSFNDPKHPNCAGVYRGAALDPSSGCVGSPVDPAWGCYGNECPVGQGPSVTKAYFLITELEQIYSPLLAQTLCALMSNSAQNAQGSNAFGDTVTRTSCRSWTQWDPVHPATGLPQGDWCAETNAPATTSCHDAFRSISYATFQGFKVQGATCTL